MLQQTPSYYVQSVVLFAAAVSSWRGIDLLLEMYIFPENRLHAAIFCVLFGAFLYVIFSEVL